MSDVSLPVRARYCWESHSSTRYCLTMSTDDFQGFFWFSGGDDRIMWRFCAIFSLYLMGCSHRLRKIKKHRWGGREKCAIRARTHPHPCKPAESWSECFLLAIKKIFFSDNFHYSCRSICHATVISWTMSHTVVTVQYGDSATAAGIISLSFCRDNTFLVDILLLQQTWRPLWFVSQLRCRCMTFHISRLLCW